MEPMGMVVQVLDTVARQLPVIVTWLVGIMLALTYWQRDPRKALLILLSCVICLFHTIVFGVLYAVLPQLLRGGMNGGAANFMVVFRILGFLGSCLSALAWALVLVAVFRRGPIPRNGIVHEQP